MHNIAGKDNIPPTYHTLKTYQRMNRNMNIAKGNINENAIYMLLWAALMLFPVLILGGSENFRWERIILEWIRLIPFMLAFTVHNNILLPVFLMKKRFVLYACTLTVCLVLTIMLFPLCRELQFAILPEEPPFMPRRMVPRRSQWLFGVRNLSDKIIFFMLIISFNILLKRFFIQQNRLRLEEKRNREMLQTELNFLKNQISPHFFMNTLNNIHALIDYSPEVAKRTIISLSRLMRHVLYDSQSKRVPVKKELDFIKSYVELMRLKTSEKVSISYSVPDDIPDKTMPPLIFTSLIENAFKHGVSLMNKSYIHIVISFPDNRHIRCSISNSNHSSNSNDGHKGIGLENTIRRLELEFPEQYELEINDTEKDFTVTLNIPL